MVAVTVKEMREAAGLSQAQLLQGCPHGITKPMLSYIEQGRVAATDEFCRWVAGKCGFAVESLAVGAAGGVITAECRREAHKKIKNSPRESDVLAALDKPMTAREVAYKLGYLERNATAPRLSEMAKAGKVEVVGRVKCSVTNVSVSLYRRVEG